MPEPGDLLLHDRRLERLGAALTGTVQDPVLSRAISHYRITAALLGELAARQTPYLESLGLLPAGGTSDNIAPLLRDALARRGVPPVGRRKPRRS